MLPVKLIQMVVKSQDHVDTIAVIDEQINECRCPALSFLVSCSRLLYTDVLIHKCELWLEMLGLNGDNLRRLVNSPTAAF